MKTTENAHLTEKEEEIMTLLWQYGPCPVRTLIEHLPEPKPHFNTVSTFIRLLEKKGCVGRHQIGGRSNLFFAILPKKTYRRGVLGSLVGKLFGNSFNMVSQLVEDSDLTPEQLKELLRMAEQNKNNTKKQ